MREIVVTTCISCTKVKASKPFPMPLPSVFVGVLNITFSCITNINTNDFCHNSVTALVVRAKKKTDRNFVFQIIRYKLFGHCRVWMVGWIGWLLLMLMFFSLLLHSFDVYATNGANERPRMKIHFVHKTLANTIEMSQCEWVCVAQYKMQFPQSQTQKSQKRIWITSPSLCVCVCVCWIKSKLKVRFQFANTYLFSFSLCTVHLYSLCSRSVSSSFSSLWLINIDKMLDITLNPPL